MNDNTKKARDNKASMEAMNSFASENLAELCQELESWHNSGFLVDGKMRALAALCTFDPADTLRHAERLTERAAINRIIALSEKEQGGQEPDGYHYRYATADGESVIRKNNGGEVNGSRPIEAVPYWYTAPEQREVPEDVLRDAERYRWLRDIQSQEDDSKVLIRGSHDSCTWDELRSGTNLDDAIDAAMLAAAKGDGNAQ